MKKYPNQGELLKAFVLEGITQGRSGRMYVQDDRVIYSTINNGIMQFMRRLEPASDGSRQFVMGRYIPGLSIRVRESLKKLLDEHKCVVVCSQGAELNNLSVLCNQINQEKNLPLETYYVNKLFIRFRGYSPEDAIQYCLSMVINDGVDMTRCSLMTMNKMLAEAAECLEGVNQVLDAMKQIYQALVEYDKCASILGVSRGDEDYWTALKDRLRPHVFKIFRYGQAAINILKENEVLADSLSPRTRASTSQPPVYTRPKAISRVKDVTDDELEEQNAFLLESIDYVSHLLALAKLKGVPEHGD